MTLSIKERDTTIYRIEIPLFVFIYDEKVSRTTITLNYRLSVGFKFVE